MNDVAVLVNTWDGYAAAWPIMAHGLQTYWPYRPWEINWMCNHLDPPMGFPIKCGWFTNWSDMMYIALREIQEQYFLFLHEDFWIVEPVLTDELFHFVSIMDFEGVDHIQLASSWDVMQSAGPSHADPARLHTVAGDSYYRTSNQASLWRTQSYLSLLRPGESPWEFEVHGSKRAKDMVCLCIAPDYDDWPLKYVYRHLPDWDIEPIVKGVWSQAAVDYCIREEIPYSFKAGDKVCSS